MSTAQSQSETWRPAISRRACERLDVELSVGVHSEHNFFAGFTSNISEGGIFIATHQERPVGSVLEIEFTLPEDDAPIVTRAQVMWVRAYNDHAEAEMPGLGLRFIDLPEEATARIQAFIERVRAPIFWED